MSRPNPIQYAERLYAAIRAANFSPISFLAFGNAVKDGVDVRRILPILSWIVSGFAMTAMPP